MAREAEWRSDGVTVENQLLSYQDREVKKKLFNCIPIVDKKHEAIAGYMLQTNLVAPSKSKKEATRKKRCSNWRFGSGQ